MRRRSPRARTCAVVAVASSRAAGDEPPAGAADLRAAARAAAWRVPREVAPLACRRVRVGTARNRLPADCLATHIDDVGCVLVPDPDGPGRGRVERAAAAGRRRSARLRAGASCAIPGSWRRRPSGALEAGAISSDGLVRAEEQLADLLLFEGSALARRIAARRLVPLDSLTAKAGERMRETTLAYVRHGGNSVEMAAELHIHPQTARYRVARLRELLGDQLDDPDARFELR